MVPPNSRRITRPSAGAVAWVTVGAVWFLRVVGNLEDHGDDFRTFYRTALRMARPIDASIPDNSSPIFTALIKPLTLLPETTALYVWTLFGLVWITLSIRRLAAARPFAHERVLWAIGACGVTMAALIGWEEGQITWLLLFLVTHAWRANDRSAWIAGVWLGVAILLKPPLALMGILLPWRVCLTAGITGVLGVAIGIVALGWPIWDEWLAMADGAVGLDHPINMSIIGVAARLAPPGSSPSLERVSLNAWIVIAIVASALAVLVWRARGDRRWAMAFLWSLTLSPAASIYYAPVGLGPLVASWPHARIALLAIAIMSIPTALLIALVSGLPPIVGDSAYAVALALLWASWWRAPMADTPEPHPALRAEKTPLSRRRL